MSVFEQLRSIMATALEIPVDVIKDSSRMEDIEEWDSLGHVHIMVALESAFDIYLDVEDFAELDNVPAILAYLSSKSIG